MFCKMKKNKVLSAMKISSIFIITLYFSLFLLNIIGKQESNNLKYINSQNKIIDNCTLNQFSNSKNELNNEICDNKVQKDNTERRISFCSGVFPNLKDFIKALNQQKIKNYLKLNDELCESQDEAFIKYSYLGVVFILGAFINVKECLKLGIL
jgi:hypothetical protein